MNLVLAFCIFFAVGVIIPMATAGRPECTAALTAYLEKYELFRCGQLSEAELKKFKVEAQVPKQYVLVTVPQSENKFVQIYSSTDGFPTDGANSEAGISVKPFLKAGFPIPQARQQEMEAFAVAEFLKKLNKNSVTKDDVIVVSRQVQATKLKRNDSNTSWEIDGNDYTEYMLYAIQLFFNL